MSAVNAAALLAASGGDDGYQISRSVRIRSSASAYLNRTPTSVTDGKKWTWSAWVKRGVLSSNQGVFDGYYNASNFTSLFFYNDKLYFYSITGGDFVTTAVFRDPSAWYHIVLTYDSANATSVDRVIIYVNNVRQAGTLTAAPSLNAVTYINNTSASQRLGIRSDVPWYFDGYVTETNFIDGQALTPSSFGETDAVTGVWKPKKYAGTYGTNGFYLNFSDPSAATAAAIGKDNSGNGNNWTPNNISVTAGVTYDSMIDVPTLWADGGNGRGNYAVLNPVSAGTTALSAGNLKASAQTNIFFGTLGATSGKWYYEAVVTTQATTAQKIGIATATATITGEVGDTSTGWAIIVQNNGNNGQGVHSGSVTSTYSTFTTNDVVNVAYDIDAGKVWFGKNGTWFNSGAPASGAGAIYTDVAGEIFPAITSKGSGSVIDANFGQRPFSYTPPTGFKALNTQNLPDATIKNGKSYFDVSLWTGNGTSQSIINSGAMQPDLVWMKGRSVAYNNTLFDSVRGVTKRLISNATNIEETASGVTAFNSNGFSVGSNIASNENAATYVGWQWKESVSAGFDIVTYTGNGTAGATVSHGLGVTPSMVIYKARSVTSPLGNWLVWHKSIGQSSFQTSTTIQLNSFTGAIYLNVTNASGTYGFDAQINGNGSNYVAYCFAEVAGFSKFGSYTGNSSADGTFVYCGFRPRFVMVKGSSGVTNWFIWDSSRDTYNVANKYLLPNSSGAEDTTSGEFDILSNGFKFRANNQANTSGVTYIFAAFAETPFKNSLAR